MHMNYITIHVCVYVWQMKCQAGSHLSEKSCVSQTLQ